MIGLKAKRGYKFYLVQFTDLKALAIKSMTKGTGLQLIKVKDRTKSAYSDCKEVYDGNLKLNSNFFGHNRKSAGLRLQIPTLTSHDPRISTNSHTSRKSGIELKK